VSIHLWQTTVFLRKKLLLNSEWALEKVGVDVSE
jgi:hypothetical protein